MLSLFRVTSNREASGVSARRVKNNRSPLFFSYKGLARVLSDNSAFYPLAENGKRNRGGGTEGLVC